MDFLVDHRVDRHVDHRVNHLVDPLVVNPVVLHRNSTLLARNWAICINEHSAEEIPQLLSQIRNGSNLARRPQKRLSHRPSIPTRISTSHEVIYEVIHVAIHAVIYGTVWIGVELHEPHPCIVHSDESNQELEMGSCGPKGLPWAQIARSRQFSSMTSTRSRWNVPCRRIGSEGFRCHAHLRQDSELLVAMN